MLSQLCVLTCLGSMNFFVLIHEPIIMHAKDLIQILQIGLLTVSRQPHEVIGVPNSAKNLLQEAIVSRHVDCCDH